MINSKRKFSYTEIPYNRRRWEKVLRINNERC